MGYFEVGVYHTKNGYNIGTLWRTAYQLGAAGLFTIGKRYRQQASDTYKAIRRIPLRHFKNWEEFSISRPIGTQLIGIEMGGIPLSEFQHPKRAIYLLGAEDHGLPISIINHCQFVVSLEAVGRLSYNVAVAGSIVLYHRCFLAPRCPLIPAWEGGPPHSRIQHEVSTSPNLTTAILSSLPGALQGRLGGKRDEMG